MTDLFDRGPLQQTTGDLPERWNQDGVELINITMTVTSTGSPDTGHTVTVGKKFYAKAIVFQSDEGVGTVSENHLRDDSTVKLKMQRDKAEGSLPLIFDAPLEFSTNINLYSPGGNDGTATVTGWEE